MYEEIMMNDDNLESYLLTSSLLKICCLVQDLLQVELCVSSIYPHHIEHFVTFLAGNTVFSLISDSPADSLVLVLG